MKHLRNIYMQIYTGLLYKCFYYYLPQRVKRLRSSSRHIVCRDNNFLVAQSMTFSFL